MRVITGSARGRRLETPRGLEVRPTSAMVKEAVFSAVQFEVEGSRVLDLFAGSGQMGIEALSRGARSCVFVDQSKDSINVIKKNLAATGLEKNAKVAASESVSFLQGYRGESFDLVFLDPPYAAGLLTAALKALAPHMSESGAVFCEAGPDMQFPEAAGALSRRKVYRYGKTQVALYRMPEEER